MAVLGGRASLQTLESMQAKNPDSIVIEVDGGFEVHDDEGGVMRYDQLGIPNLDSNVLEYLREKMGPGTPGHIMLSVGYVGRVDDFEEHILSPLAEQGAIEQIDAGKGPFYVIK